MRRRNKAVAIKDKPEYRLHTLGWYGFQRLCVAVMKQVLGQDVRSFLETNDAGRDGAWTGHWRKRRDTDVAGEFVLQCKFSADEGRTLQPAMLQDELSKARRLVRRHLCDVYVLMTNMGVSGQTEAKLVEAFRAVGVRHLLCFGSDWICGTIQEHKKLRLMVPRVYGLGDLSQILDDRAYDQAEALLASLQEDLAKVVLTGCYERSARALLKHGFVLLVGEPASGKTTIASLLAMAAIDQWGSSTIKVSQPGDIQSHWNPNEPSQFFLGG